MNVCWMSGHSGDIYQIEYLDDIVLERDHIFSMLL